MPDGISSGPIGFLFLRFFNSLSFFIRGCGRCLCCFFFISLTVAISYFESDILNSFFKMFFHVLIFYGRSIIIFALSSFMRPFRFLLPLLSLIFLFKLNELCLHTSALIYSHLCCLYFSMIFHFISW